MPDPLPTELLSLFDQDERFAACSPDMRRDELAHVVRQVDQLGHDGCVIFSRLTADTADAAIEEQMTYFESIGQDFEWKAYAHDQPADLIHRLASHGFSIDETEAVMVLDLHHVSSNLLTPTPVAQRVTDLDELVSVESIRRRVYGDSRDVVARLAEEIRRDPESLSIYITYVNETPAACGWIRFPRASAFASLWGGSTVPELRHHGLYTALLAARVQEARGRGYRYLTVDAGSMSRPILEKRGFVLLTRATACTWSATTATQ